MDPSLSRLVKDVDAFLRGESKVHETLRRLADRLDEAGVEFAVAGGLAVGARGHLRVTVDIDLLVSAEGLGRFKDRWLGRGYAERFPGSKGVKDSETGVPIDFLVAGDYPGDGKPKPVRFPDPASLPRGEGSPRVLDLRTLIELKLASGVSAADRLIDLADVIALIRANRLGAEFVDGLDPSVQSKFAELWRAAQSEHKP
jgi:hypothetical protein